MFHQFLVKTKVASLELLVSFKAIFVTSIFIPAYPETGKSVRKYLIWLRFEPRSSGLPRLSQFPRHFSTYYFSITDLPLQTFSPPGRYFTKPHNNVNFTPSALEWEYYLTGCLREKIDVILLSLHHFTMRRPHFYIFSESRDDIYTLFYILVPSQ
jgi:hypothetical protein